MAGVLWKKDLVSPGMKIIYVLVNGVQGECRPGDKRVQKGWEKLPSSSVWMPQIWQGESSIFQTRTINLSLSVHTVFSVCHQTSANDKCCFLKFLLGNQFWPSTVCLTSSTESSGAPLALFMMCWNWRAGRAVSVIYNEIINEVDHGALCFFCVNALMRNGAIVPSFSSESPKSFLRFYSPQISQIRKSSKLLVLWSASSFFMIYYLLQGVDGLPQSELGLLHESCFSPQIF